MVNGTKSSPHEANLFLWTELLNFYGDRAQSTIKKTYN